MKNEMKLNIDKESGVIQIDNARIVFRNFEGLPTKFNREGDRNFAVVIPNDEIKDALVAEGWNVKVRESEEPDEEPFMYLSVKVGYKEGRGPAIYLQSGEAVNRLNEDTVSLLDQIDISNVSMDIRPYDWEVNGKTGRAAYLLSMNVKQNIDRFGAAYAEEGKLD